MRKRYVEWLERRWLFAVVPSGFTDELYEGGLSAPAAMEFAPDGRLFVAQQGGNLRVIDAAGNLLAASFASLDVDSVGERGLLGVTFDPNFAANGFVYVYYTVPNGPDGSAGAFNRVSRFTAADADANPANGYTPGNTAVPGSELPLVQLDNLTTATNHNGGAIHFGGDGKLYVAVGENANAANAQTLANRHGKLLRYNADGSIPTDNPFYGTASGANRAIWALGLRNPYTFAVQPGTGVIHVNDVGQSTWEEVNVGQAGANYGWGNPGGNIEGPRTTQPLPTLGTYRDPLHAYRHPFSGSNPNEVGIAITGGAFYNPPAQQFPADYNGDYFFADLGNGSRTGGHWIRKLEAGTGTSTLFASGLSNPVDLKVGDDGALYYLERGSNAVRRIRANVPAWLVPGGAATWNGTTLNVTGSATIVGDTGNALIVGSVAAADLTIDPAGGSQVSVGGLSLSNGATARLADAAAGRMLVVGSGGLSVTGSSTLDLTDNTLVVRGGSLPAVRSLITAGFAGGAWTGAGLSSSTAAADGTRATALGYATAGQLGVTSFLGVTGLATTDVLVRQTYYGDTNLDQLVNTDDILRILAGGKLDTASPATWFDGDFTFDDFATTDDILQLLATGRLDQP